LTIELKAEAVVILFFIMDYYNYREVFKKPIPMEKDIKYIDEVKSSINDLSYIENSGILDLEIKTKQYLKSSQQIAIQTTTIRRTTSNGCI